MGLLNRFFGKKPNPITDQVMDIIKAARDTAKKPKGLDQSAVSGAQRRQRLISLIEKVEAQIGQMAIAVAEKEGVLMIHPKLTEEIRKQADKDILEPALEFCFPTLDGKRRAKAGWPATISSYRERSNTDDVLREKAAILAVFVTCNLDLGIQLYEEMRDEEMRDSQNTTELSDEQETSMKLEEAACWCRIIDELAHDFLGQNRSLFMDYFGDNVTEILALEGMPPGLICQTIRERMAEYAQYRKWIPEGKEGNKGTLLWEAAKHVGNPLQLGRNPLFLITFGSRVLQHLESMMVQDLLTGP
jgi:hypothetical protein